MLRRIFTQQPSRLSRRVLSYVLATSGIFLALATIVTLVTTYKRDMRAIETTFDHIGSSYVPGISADVYTFDHERLRIQLHGMLELQDIVRLELLEQRGDEVIATAVGEPLPTRAIVREFTLAHTGPDGVNRVYGSLRAVADRGQVMANVGRTCLDNLFISVLVIGLISLCIHLVVRLVFTRRVLELASFANSLTLDGLHRRPPPRPVRGRRRDEFDDLWQSFLDLQDRLLDGLERRRAAEQIRAREQSTLQSLIDSIPDLIYYKSRDLVYLGGNRAFVTFLGGDSRAALAGRSDADLFPPEVAEANQLDDREVLLARRPRTEEVLLKDHAGRELMFHTLKTPFFGPNGELLGLIGVCRDITAAKTAEQALMRSQKMEAVGQMAGGVAHDFNNILAIIVGNLDLLVNLSDLDSQARDLTGLALKAATRGSHLTRRLLAFTEASTPDVSPMDVGAIILDMRGIIEQSLTGAITVRTRLADDLWPTDVNPGELEDVLVNLSLNARDAMPDGGTLTIETSNVILSEDELASQAGAGPGPYVRIAVTDTGTGMPAEVRERVFEPFFTTKDPGKGTGLGLSMAYGALQRVHGFVDIDSAIGDGTTVALYIPRSDQVAVPPAHDMLDEEEAPRGSETLLVVEDEPALLEVAEHTLRTLGYTVLTAANGNEALRSLQDRARVDLMFSDVVMPGGIDGFGLAQQAQAAHPGLKILLASGFPRESGTNGYRVLKKPYRRNKLARLIREILDEE